MTWREYIIACNRTHFMFQASWDVNRGKPEVASQKPRWRRSPSWIYKNHYNSSKYWPIFMKFETRIHWNIPDLRNQNRKLQVKNQDGGGGRHLEFSKTTITRPNIDRSLWNLKHTFSTASFIGPNHKRKSQLKNQAAAAILNLQKPL